MLCSLVMFLLWSKNIRDSFHKGELVVEYLLVLNLFLFG